MSDYSDRPLVVRVLWNRCYGCGRLWAHEPVRRADCPMCALGKIESLHQEVARLERSNRSLRGALTRSKTRGQ